MRKYRLATLYSGSEGNCTFICSGNTSILIDAGKSARTLCARLSEIGSDIKNISAIFITHEHTDHVSALETLSKKYHIPIHITDRSATKFDRTPDAAVHSCLVRHDTVFCQTVGDITVRSFPTPHDSMMSVGYRVSFEADGQKHIWGVATDIGHVTSQIRDGLDGCEAVVLESNHDEQMLISGTYPRELKIRILSERGHLSNHDSSELAAALARGGCKSFILAHLSRENNKPCLAYEAAVNEIADHSVRVRVASADVPCELCFDFAEV